MAGVRSTIVSLWNVDDRATAALMQLFYNKLWVDGLPAPKALRQAQLTLMRNPRLIDQIGSSRAPRVTKTIPLPPAGDDRARPSKRAPIKYWAAFVLSGLGK